MRHLNNAINALGDLAMRPFADVDAWWGLAWASLLTTLVLLPLFRVLSNQKSLRRKKGRLIARVMELVLFRHDLGESARACGRIMTANFSYLWEVLKPMLVASVPCIVLLVQFGTWFEHRPLKPGETAVLEVQFREPLPTSAAEAVLETSGQMQPETEAVRIPALGQMAWRLRAVGSGEGWIDLTFDGETVRKSVTVGERFTRVSPRRPGAGVWDQFLNPVESRLSDGSTIESITVTYPARMLYIGNTEVHWLLAFFVLTIVFGLVLKRPFKVDF